MTSGLMTANTTNGAGATLLNLSGMTKAQLLEYAEDNGISGVTSRNTKADIIAAIEEA